MLAVDVVARMVLHLQHHHLPLALALVDFMAQR